MDEGKDEPEIWDDSLLKDALNPSDFRTCVLHSFVDRDHLKMAPVSSLCVLSSPRLPPGPHAIARPRPPFAPGGSRLNLGRMGCRLEEFGDISVEYIVAGHGYVGSVEYVTGGQVAVDDGTISPILSVISCSSGEVVAELTSLSFEQQLKGPLGQYRSSEDRFMNDIYVVGVWPLRESTDGREVHHPVVMALLVDSATHDPFFVFWNWHSGEIVQHLKLGKDDDIEEFSVLPVENSSMFVLSEAADQPETPMLCVLDVQVPSADKVVTVLHSMKNCSPKYMFHPIGCCRAVSSGIVEFVATNSDDDDPATEGYYHIGLHRFSLATGILSTLKRWRPVMNLVFKNQAMRLGDAIAFRQDVDPRAYGAFACTSDTRLFYFNDDLGIQFVRRFQDDGKEGVAQDGFIPYNSPAVRELRLSSKYATVSTTDDEALLPVVKLVARLGDKRDPVICLLNDVPTYGPLPKLPGVPKRGLRFVSGSTMGHLMKVPLPVPADLHPTDSLTDGFHYLAVAGSPSGLCFVAGNEMVLKVGDSTNVIIMCRTPFVDASIGFGKESEDERLQFLFRYERCRCMSVTMGLVGLPVWKSFLH